MPLRKTEAIILKSQRQGETSKILTLYTRAFGKIKVIAKGARSSKSKFGGSLEPVNYVAIVFYEKENRDLQFLSQADIIESFSRIKKDLDKTTISLAVCELVNRLEIGLEPNPPLFRLFLELLHAINLTENDPMNLFRAFQVRLFDVFGFRPQFDACLKCGNQNVGQVVFDIRHGGYICEDCSYADTPGVKLTPNSLAGLREFQRESLSGLGALISSAYSQQQVDAFLDAYLKYHFEGLAELNTLKFIKKMRENNWV